MCGRKSLRCTVLSMLSMVLVMAAPALTADPGRVRVVDNTVVLPDGKTPIRGFNFNIYRTALAEARTRDLALWTSWRDTWKVNACRLWIKRETPLEYTTYGTWPMQELLKILDQAVETASKAGMYVVLDFHSKDCRINDPAQIAELKSFWTAVAPRYANRTHVIYELANEPTCGSLSDELAKMETDVYALIRSKAPDSHVITCSFARLTLSMIESVAKIKGVGWSNASVGFHTYGGTGNVPALKAKYPAICTEFGSTSHIKDLERYGVAWVGCGSDPDNVDYMASICSWCNGGSVAADLNKPPAITLLSPTTGGTFTTRSGITMKVGASDPDGSVAKVEFWYASIKKGEDAGVPYEFTFTNLPVGDGTIYAVAVDNKGARTESDVLEIMVTDANAPATKITQGLPSQVIEGETYTVAGEGSELVWYYEADSDGKGNVGIGSGPSVSFAVPTGISGTRTIYLVLKGTNGTVESATSTIVDEATGAITRPGRVSRKPAGNGSPEVYRLDGARAGRRAYAVRDAGFRGGNGVEIVVDGRGDVRRRLRRAQ